MQMSVPTASVAIMTGFISTYSLVMIFSHSATYGSVGEQGYWAGLEGEFEIPKVDTSSSGMAVFKITQDNMGYIINVTGIDKVTSAHIHSGGIGENGPIVALLFGTTGTVTGNINGTLTQGNVSGEMLTDQLGAMRLSELALLMKHSTAYVDLHTVDYPNGEIRGQIMSVNSTHAELMMN
jgi:hypothetical protein